MGTTHYRWNPVTDNVLCEQDENGAVLATYTHEPTLHGELISQNRGGQTSHYHYDGQGSTRALTDENGDVTDTYTYDAFGETIAKTGTTVNPYRFGGAKGYQYNEETDDYYIRARTYEPAIARWLSVDPAGFVDGVNLWRYVGNNPGNLVDPSGFACEDLYFWDESACRSCPPCTCEEMHPVGRGGLGPFFNDFLATIARDIKKSMGFENLRCKINFRIGDCGLAPGVARTCGKGRRKNKREIYICFQQGIERCVLLQVIAHELIHAKQLCEQVNGSEALGGNCEDNERPAWTASCKRWLAQDCKRDGVYAGYEGELSACVASGVDKSCNLFPGQAQKTCKEIVEMIDGPPNPNKLPWPQNPPF